MKKNEFSNAAKSIPFSEREICRGSELFDETTSIPII